MALNWQWQKLLGYTILLFSARSPFLLVHCLLWSLTLPSGSFSSKPTCEVGVGNHDFLEESTAFNTGS